MGVGEFKAHFHPVLKSTLSLILYKAVLKSSRAKTPHLHNKIMIYIHFAGVQMIPRGARKQQGSRPRDSSMGNHCHGRGSASVGTILCPAHHWQHAAQRDSIHSAALSPLRTRTHAVLKCFKQLIRVSSPPLSHKMIIAL